MTSSSPKQLIDIGKKQLGVYVTDAFKLTLSSRKGGLECRAAITVYDRNNTISPIELMTILGNLGVMEGIDLEQIAVFCSEAAKGENLDEILLAAGKNAVPGKDGWFELLFSTGQEQTGLAEDDSGRIDFRSIQSFPSAEPGQRIGRIYSPEAGTQGNTIFGKILPPRPGKPCAIVIAKGAYLDDDGVYVIAEHGGRVILDDNTLSVVDELVVDGDVNFHIGHIHFNGFVAIKGDVLDSFNVTATKGVQVDGVVGACRIYSDGPVRIGSMAGQTKGQVICKGSFRARYLNQASVECWGDIYIGNEARGSILKATGSINAPDGLITGGTAIALEGINAKLLGARASGGTNLTAGVFFPESERLNCLCTRLASIEEQLKKLGITLAVLNKKNLAKFRPALREATELRIGVLTQRRANLGAEEEELRQEVAQFQRGMHPTANPRISVSGVIRGRVTMTLGETTKEIPGDLYGPLTIIENHEQEGFRFLPHA